MPRGLGPLMGAPPDQAEADAAFVARAARRLGRDADEAAELTQEVLLRALRRGLDAPEPGWLRRMLLDARRDTRRADARRGAREQQAIDANAAPHDPTAPTAETQLHRARIDEELGKLIDELPEGLRACVTLTYFAGLDSGEVAVRLGVPRSTVRRRNQLALARLRAAIERRFDIGGRSWRDLLMAIVLGPRRSAIGPSRRTAGRAVRFLAGATAVGAAAVIALLAPAGAPQLVSSAAIAASPPRVRTDRNGTTTATAPLSTATETANAGTVGDVDPSEQPVTDAACAGPSLQALVDGAAPGAIVSVPACMYREGVVVTRPLTLIAEPGAEIRGSDVWTEFHATAGRPPWRSDRAVPAFSTLSQPCFAEDRESCRDPEQVFVDGVALPRVPAEPVGRQWALAADRRVELGFDPAAHAIEISVRQTWLTVRASDVVVRGFRMRHAASEKDVAGIQVNLGTQRVVLRDNTMSDAATHALRLAGSGHRLENNAFLDVGGMAMRLADLDDVAVIGNRVDRAGLGYRHGRGWFGGAVTAIVVSGVLRGNVVADGRGSGIFLVHAHDLAVEDNVVRDHVGGGLLIFRSKRLRVRTNRLWNNGWGASPSEPAIAVTSSRDVAVVDNVIAGHPDGVLVSPVPRFDSCRSTNRVWVTSNRLVGPGASIRFFGDSVLRAEPPACAGHTAVANRLWSLDADLPAPLGIVQEAMSDLERDELLASLR